ncbi:hypothetical protein BG000_002346, partial [Podila horticola]
MRSTTPSDEPITRQTLTPETAEPLEYMLHRDHTNLGRFDFLVHMMQGQDQEQGPLRELPRPMPSLVIPSEEARAKILDVYSNLQHLFPALTDDQMTAIMAYHEEVYLSVHRDFFEYIFAAQEQGASSSNPSPQPESETSDHHTEQEKEQEQEQKVEHLEEPQSSAHHIEHEELPPAHREPSDARESSIREAQDTGDSSSVTQNTVHPYAYQRNSPQNSSHNQRFFHLYDRQRMFLLVIKVLLLIIEVHILITMACLLIIKTPILTITIIVKVPPPFLTKTRILIRTTALKDLMIIIKIPPTTLTSTTVHKAHILSSTIPTVTGTMATKAPLLITLTLTRTTIKVSLLITKTIILTRTTILKPPFLNFMVPLLITKGLLLFIKAHILSILPRLHITETRPTLSVTRTTALKDLLHVIKVLSTKEKASASASN